jgi:tetratricopeptide (TPR) repeat protein
MALSVTSLRAQKKGSIGFNVHGPTGGPSAGVYDSTLHTNPAAGEEKCFPWNLSEVRVATVSLTRLKVPSKARHDYEQACDALNKNKFKEAEQHARSAIEKYKSYSAAWIMLGVILEEQHKSQEARNACSQAATIDPKYLPAYFCGAEVSARNGEWTQALTLADQALSLEPEGDAYGYYYRAIAHLHMNNLVEAKKSALQAAAIDLNHAEPFLSLLLADIYQREGDTANAIDQLRQLLRRHTDRQEEATAKQLLAKLESHPRTHTK